MHHSRGTISNLFYRSAYSVISINIYVLQIKEHNLIFFPHHPYIDWFGNMLKLQKIKIFSSTHIFLYLFKDNAVQNLTNCGSKLRTEYKKPTQLYKAYKKVYFTD